MHRTRLTERKIARRLELVETLIYRRRQPVPPFRFHPGDDPLVVPNVDNGDWPVMEPGACWGELGQDFTMRTTFTVPTDDCIAVMHGGQILQYDTPLNVYDKPADLFVDGPMVLTGLTLWRRREKAGQ